MGKLRVAGVILLVVLLAVSTGAANAAVAAERTVLSGEYVKAALAEEGAYDLGASLLTEQVTGGTDAGDGDEFGALPISTSALVEDAITREYVAGQVGDNVDRVYGYLHGERDSAAVAFDLEPVGANMAAGVESRLREASLSALLEPMADEDGDVELAGVTVDPAALDDLAESEAAYRETRAEFRAQVRAGVLDRAVEDAVADASNDELLALVIEDYDPDDYTEAEKERMVGEREDEIEAAAREEIEARRGEEIDEEVEAQLAALPETVRESVEESDGTDDVPPEMVEAYADLLVVGAEGLAGDMAYETYTDRLEGAKGDFAAEAAGAFEADLSEDMPAEATLLDTSDPETGGALAEARRAVGIVDVLSVALPAVALALVGLLWWLTRSPAVTAAGAGVGLLLGGIPGVALAGVLPPMLADVLGGGMPAELREVVLGLVERTAATVAAQSAALVVVGVLLVAGSLYLRAYGTPEWVEGIRG